MTSLIIWSVICASYGLVMAWAVARAAQAAGSMRGTLRVGLAAVGTLLVLNVALAILLQSTAPKAGAGAIVVAALALAVQLVISLLVMRRAFRLSTGRAFAPVGACYGVGIGYLVIMVGLVRPNLTEAFVISSQSMVPTLQPGDRVFVGKRLTPRRWDLVAYRVTEARGGPTVYCKRLVGLPGERLRFDGGELYVNDQRQADAPALLAHRLLIAPPGFPASALRYQDGETIQLGADEIFLIGDDLTRSLDSRTDGPSRRSDIVGVADLRYWPPGRAGLLR
jgi:signal peptidase I